MHRARLQVFLKSLASVGFMEKTNSEQRRDGSCPMHIRRKYAQTLIMTIGLICSRNRKLDRAAGAKMDGGRRAGAGVRSNRERGKHYKGFTYTPSEEFTKEF